MTLFDMTPIMLDVGQSFTVSGVTKTIGEAWSDTTESYTDYVLSGVVEVVDGSSELVTEGLLRRNDIVIYAPDDQTNVSQLALDNYVTFSSGIVSGSVYRIVDSIHNRGHYEVAAKRVLEA